MRWHLIKAHFFTGLVHFLVRPQAGRPVQPRLRDAVYDHFSAVGAAPPARRPVAAADDWPREHLDRAAVRAPTTAPGNIRHIVQGALNNELWRSR